MTTKADRVFNWKNSRRLKEYWKNKDYREKMSKVASETRKRNWQDPGYRQDRRRWRRKLWEDPTYREQISKSFSEGAKRKWKDKKKRKGLEKQLALARGNSITPSKIQVSFFRKLCRAGIKGFRLEYRVGTYSVDIANPKKKLAIEIDGSYWHSKSADRRRDRNLKQFGWKTVRISTSRAESMTLGDIRELLQ